MTPGRVLHLFCVAVSNCIVLIKHTPDSANPKDFTLGSHVSGSSCDLNHLGFRSDFAFGISKVPCVDMLVYVATGGCLTSYLLPGDVFFRAEAVEDGNGVLSGYRFKVDAKRIDGE